MSRKWEIMEEDVILSTKEETINVSEEIGDAYVLKGSYVGNNLRFSRTLNPEKIINGVKY